MQRAAVAGGLPGQNGASRLLELLEDEARTLGAIQMVLNTDLMSHPTPLRRLLVGRRNPGRGRGHTIPSWAIVATQDKVIPPALERFLYQRAGPHVVEAPAHPTSP
ncbi:hypothetical protein [Streptomyces sp. NPDC059893]